MVVIVTTQSRVAAGGQDFKHALCEAQDRNIESAATQIKHGINAFARIVETVSNGRCGGFVDQAQHIQAGQLGCVFGGLALGVVKVGGHGDDRAVEVIVEGVFGSVTQGGQDLGTDFDRRFGALHRLDTEHALLAGGELVRQFAAVGDVAQATAHEAFDRGDGVDRVRCGGLHGVKTDLAALPWHETHDRRQDHASIVIGQAFGHAAAHRSHQRMRGAQVNAHRDAALVRVGRLARFRNLE